MTTIAYTDGAMFAYILLFALLFYIGYSIGARRHKQKIEKEIIQKVQDSKK